MIEVLKQMVEALEWSHGGEPIGTAEAIKVGRQAIAELESQEPVALPCCGYTDASAVKWNPLNGVVQCHNCGQNYTTSQRTWVGLTDEEIVKIVNSNSSKGLYLMAKAIEAKLKELNT
jgi:hypothetical protein